MSIRTSLAEEREFQRAWTARLREPKPSYSRLVDNEFAAPEMRDAGVQRALTDILRFAATEVPHYRERMTKKTSEGPGLAAFPILTKFDIQDAGPHMLPRQLPNGVKPSHWTASSGTTGRPVRVLHSSSSASMFSLLKQREYRWFRFDPRGTLASMRMAMHLPRTQAGKTLADGEMLMLPTWQYLKDFATGPFIAMTLTTPMDARIAWLRRERPDYLISFAESFELLALASECEKPADSLKGLVAISEQVTSGMRTFIERRLGAPVHQNYGLNEIGIVALRCSAGRYHVHGEHCLVEIVDAEGHASPAGQTGRLIVTTLTNFAMPLVRYDTGDLAEAVAGACPCGRTLPSFGEIVGRYSRVAFLPPGTPFLMMTLRETIETMPIELARDLREFQLHQYKDKHMELRVVARAPLPEPFFDRIHAVWSKAAGADGPSLTIVAVDAIRKSASGKAEVFTSDFMPARDDAG